MNASKTQYKVWMAFGPEMVIRAYSKMDAREQFARELGIARSEFHRINVD